MDRRWVYELRSERRVCSLGTRSQHEHMMQRGHDYEAVEELLTGYSSSTHRKVPAEEPNKFKSVRILHHVTLDPIFNGALADSARQSDGIQSIRLTISESCRTQSSAASSSSQLEIMAITPSVSSTMAQQPVHK